MVTASVMELSLGRTPGIDGLLTEFFSSLWTVIGMTFLTYFENPSIKKISACSFNLTSKRRGFNFIKELNSECLAKILNIVLQQVIYKDQSYCIKGGSIGTFSFVTGRGKDHN